MKLAEGLVERVLKRTVKSRLKMVQVVVQRAGKVLLGRLARGLLVALPLVGAVFIAQLCRHDYQRLDSEREHQAKERRESGGESATLGRSSVGGALAVGCFAVAFLCDLFDAVAHLVVAAGTLIPALPHDFLGCLAPFQAWEHHLIHVAESASWVLALGAMAAATAGELLSSFTAVHSLPNQDHQAFPKPPPPPPAFHGLAPDWSSAA